MYESLSGFFPSAALAFPPGCSIYQSFGSFNGGVRIFHCMWPQFVNPFAQRWTWGFAAKGTGSQEGGGEPIRPRWEGLPDSGTPIPQKSHQKTPALDKSRRLNCLGPPEGCSLAQRGRPRGRQGRAWQLSSTARPRSMPGAVTVLEAGSFQESPCLASRRHGLWYW